MTVADPHTDVADHWGLLCIRSGNFIEWTTDETTRDKRIADLTRDSDYDYGVAEFNSHGDVIRLWPPEGK